MVPATQEVEVGGSEFKASLGKVSTRSNCKTKSKRTGSLAHMVEYFMLEALSSIPSTTK
jgi:hypothetical protein